MKRPDVKVTGAGVSGESQLGRKEKLVAPRIPGENESLAVPPNPPFPPYDDGGGGGGGGGEEIGIVQICPIMSSGTSNPARCVGTECVLWVNKKCAIVTIALSLTHVASVARKQR
jgi:hypothetical protein